MKPLHMLQGGGDISISMEVALCFYGEAGDDLCICTHLPVLTGKILSLLVKQRAVSKLNESCVISK